jgi:hypothetical protein
MVLVGGAPGIGKTALVNQPRSPTGRALTPGEVRPLTGRHRASGRRATGPRVFQVSDLARVLGDRFRVPPSVGRPVGAKSRHDFTDRLC